jgi:predicted nuclease with TOPRIM domain
MTTTPSNGQPPDRLDRVEALLAALAERDVQHDERLTRLEAAQDRTQEQIDRLTARQDRTQEQLDALAERQARTDERFADLIERQARTDERFADLIERSALNDELVANQGVTTQQLVQVTAALVRIVGDLQTDVRGLRTEVQRAVQMFLDERGRGEQP